MVPPIAHHVHAGVAHRGEPGRYDCRIARQRDDIGVGPAGAAAEHRHAIDCDGEAAAIVAALHVDGAKADRVRGRTACRRVADASAVQARVRHACAATRARRPGTCQFALQHVRRRCVGALPRGRRVPRRPRRPPAGRARRGSPRGPRRPARRCAGPLASMPMPSPRRLAQDRPPWADRMHGRAPARHVPEQRRARETQIGRRDQARAPPGASASAAASQARARLRKQICRSLVAPVRTAIRCGRNMLSDRSRAPVQPDLGDGGEAFEVQDLVAAAGEAAYDTRCRADPVRAALRRSIAPAARSAEANVPGTGAGSQCRAGSVSGDATAPASCGRTPSVRSGRTQRCRAGADPGHARDVSSRSR